MILRTYFFTVWHFGFEELKVTTTSEEVLKYYIKRFKPFQVKYYDEEGKGVIIYDCKGSSQRGVILQYFF